uniref:Uncharacterized protein n=1 Tax=Anguilla anguilla TaxID=7936 RepID=A0A0E9RES7_ANGAN
MGSVDPHAACPTESGTRRFCGKRLWYITLYKCSFPFSERIQECEPRKY